MTVDYEIYKEGGILKDRYQKIEDISEGSYGYVSLAKDLKEKRLVAVKYIFKLDDEEDESDYSDPDKDYDSSIEKKQVHQDKKKSLVISDDVKARLTNDICLEAMYEVDIQTKIGKHKNIVQLLDFFDSYIIMEYCSGGDLYEAIKDDIVPRTTKSITHIITQIIDAIEFVHGEHIYHRDIKPENILITGIDWTIKLTDWGLATTDFTSMDRSVGSERYMSPELFDSNLDLEERKEPYQCDKVDLWAMGIVFLNIVFHKNPFSVANQSDKSFCYFAANREALFDVFSSMTYDFFQVLRYCLTIDPTNRDLKQMRNELNNLNEYTFDDEYYNNLEENEEYSTGYDTEVSETMTVTPGPEPMTAHTQPPPPSSAPVSLPTPISSSKPLPQLVNKEPEQPAVERIQTKEKTLVDPVQEDTTTSANKIKQRTSDIEDNISQSSQENIKKQLDVPKFNIVQDKLYNHYKNPNTKTTASSSYHANDHLYPDRARSTPKFKYNKKSRGKKRNGRYHIKPIRIENRNKSKIIKHSRKPLGIPTPNTHINNFFHDYKKSKEKHDFNTRDFFTPPSVQNRYMEGVFDHKYRNNKSKYYNNNNNYNSNYNSNYNNNYNGHSSYNGNKGWNNNYVNNTNNGFSNSYKYNKFRRPSTTGNSSYNVNSIKNSYGQRNSFNNGSVNSGFLRRSSMTTYSPGSYIPPNARNSISAATGNNNPLPNMAYASLSTYSNIPDISTVLDNNNNHPNSSPDSVKSHHSRESIKLSGGNTRRNDNVTAHELNTLNDDGHESDGVLFTLEENDNNDLVNNFNNLMIDGSNNNKKMNHASASTSPVISSPYHNDGNNNETLLHPPSLPQQHAIPSVLVSPHLHNQNNNNDNSNIPTKLSHTPEISLDTNTTSDLPDLLKSPVSSSINSTENPALSDHMNISSNVMKNETLLNPLVNSEYSDNINGSILHRGSFDNQNLRSYKPGVYVPPHHRRGSINPTSTTPPTSTSLNNDNNTYENMLSVSNNHINYGNSLQNPHYDNRRRRKSSYNRNQHYYNNNNYNNNNTGRNNENIQDGGKSFNNPIMPINHSQSTISLQNEYVFADSNNDALLFEDDIDEDADNEYEDDPHNSRTRFGPYEIYDNESDHDKIDRFRAGRKSSKLQDEIVGSLEQYKNNWLMLQQPQQE